MIGEKEDWYIPVEETCITPDMVPRINEADYKYYYVDKNLSRPLIMEYYTPSNDVMIVPFSKNDVERMIYPLDGPYGEEEETAYEKFQVYLKEIKETFPESLTKRRIMRFLNSNSFKLKETYNNIKEHLDWRKVMLPIILTQENIALIERGFIYVHGRDRHFRPFLFVNADIIAIEGIDPENVFQTSWFVTIYIVQNLLKRGSVENCIDVVNLGGLPIDKIPREALKKFIVEIQVHLKGRIAKMLFLHVTFGLRMIYFFISPFLEAKVKNKIIMKGDGSSKEILELAHPSQIEKKYGGTAENLTQFWPPRAISDEYDPYPKCINFEEFKKAKEAQKSLASEKQALLKENSEENKERSFEVIKIPQRSLAAKNYEVNTEENIDTMKQGKKEFMWPVRAGTEGEVKKRSDCCCCIF
ncbi:unnamed protein product [Moneuplotes crassus]|uniref:CRAL-TRIO domain-containing protein n=1 Tax=Euplotes crassus TaxID=5936 RepID=A0AAD1UC78_EUPCR|nr:unnamed protein product [Moneuplotes crassus]